MERDQMRRVKSRIPRGRYARPSYFNVDNRSIQVPPTDGARLPWLRCKRLRSADVLHAEHGPPARHCAVQQRCIHRLRMGGSTFANTGTPLHITRDQFDKPRAGLQTSHKRRPPTCLRVSGPSLVELKDVADLKKSRHCGAAPALRLARNAAAKLAIRYA